MINNEDLEYYIELLNDELAREIEQEMTEEEYFRSCDRNDWYIADIVENISSSSDSASHNILGSNWNCKVLWVH